MIESLLIANSGILFTVSTIAFIISSFIPLLPYRQVVQLVQVILIALSVYFMGMKTERTGWELKMSEAQLEIAALQALSGTVNERIITEFIPKIKYIDKIQTQVVTEFITVESDKKCEINNGFVRLHDSVVKQKSIQPDPSDSLPSAIKLSDVGETVKFNYQTCYRNAEQLRALQSWVKEQELIWNSSK